jgi:hypothetical protein
LAEQLRCPSRVGIDNLAGAECSLTQPRSADLRRAPSVLDVKAVVVFFTSWKTQSDQAQVPHETMQKGSCHRFYNLHRLYIDRGHPLQQINYVFLVIREAIGIKLLCDRGVFGFLLFVSL